MFKWINFGLFVLSTHAHALHVKHLEFHATQTCPTHVTTHQKPYFNNAEIHPQELYIVHEIDKPSPNWVRLEMTTDHSLQWVRSTCGMIQKNNTNFSGCDKANIADSYVLALSSLPGFCETYGYEAGKPECRHLAKESYQAQHLTLHGLWPNRDVCGQRYGFCEVTPLANHCDYAPVDLSPSVDVRLKKLMPSLFYGSCLERHEWNKHGSCQSLSADDYFSLAMHFTQEVDQSLLGTYLTQHHGQTIERSKLRTAINQTFGKFNAGKVYLGCKNDILVDIYISLPPLFSANDSLISVVDKAPEYSLRDTCGAKVRISHFSNDSWF